MLHTLAIILHALSAIAAFIVGIILIFQSDTLRRLQLARALVALLGSMGVFLLIAIFTHPTSLPSIKKFVFGGLVVLLAYMIFRATQALTVLTQPRGGDQLKVVDHVGFVLISLFDGFAIVSAIDLKAPGWLVAVIAVGAVAIGIYGLTARKNTLKTQTT